jgi:hypothetical protein
MDLALDKIPLTHNPAIGLSKVGLETVAGAIGWPYHAVRVEVNPSPYAK